jgi:uncharacterized protein DUF5949
MTQSNTASATSLMSRLGTLVVIPWAGEHQEDGGDMAFLMAYTLGDGVTGAEGSQSAALTVAQEAGLPVGGTVLDVAQVPQSPVKVLVESGKAVLTLPYLHVACPVPEPWVAAARERGTVYVIIASRPWPEAVPGRPVTEAALQAFAADESMLRTAAHGLVPVAAPAS